MQNLAGTYEGEGPNTTAGIANVPDTNAAGAGGTNAPESPQWTADIAKKAQGKVQGVAITRRRQLRVSSEGARSETAINVGGGNQVLTNYARGVYISTGGTLVCRLADATADSTFTGLLAGVIYPFHIASVTAAGTTVAGNLLF